MSATRATACELARSGARVALIDQARLPNPRAASTDHSKIFRFAYPDALYVRLAVDALNRWRVLEEETGARLLTPAGLLMIGKADSSIEGEIAATLQSLGLEAETMTNTETTARFPQFNLAAFDYAVLDPSGAITDAERAVRAMIALARGRAAAIIES